MALTRSFKETVKARAAQDPAFRVALLEEALEAFVNADLETGKVLLRDYVNATLGFEELGARLHKSPKSLMRMLSTEGNPRANNLFAVVAHLKEREGLRFDITLHGRQPPAKGLCQVPGDHSAIASEDIQI